MHVLLLENDSLRLFNLCEETKNSCFQMLAKLSLSSASPIVAAALFSKQRSCGGGVAMGVLHADDARK